MAIIFYKHYIHAGIINDAKPMTINDARRANDTRSVNDAEGQ